MNILVTGGTGFLGRHLVGKLQDQGHEVDWCDSRMDLTDDTTAFDVMARGWDCVFHLAAICGGIGLNQSMPATLWRENLLMGVNVLEAARLAGVKKLVMVGTTCSYPKTPKTIPFIESELFDGYPEETNAPYGIAKRALLAGAWAYRKQYGMNIVYAIPTNLYGPGDNFDPQTSHVIPAMIRKFHEAKVKGERIVTLWGTGKATRDFLYVEDCAEALVKMMDHYDQPEPLNIGKGHGFPISQVAAMVRSVVSYEGSTVWDSTKPDGQPARALNVTRTMEVLGWRDEVSLAEGIKKTYEWYLKHEEVTA